VPPARGVFVAFEEQSHGIAQLRCGLLVGELGQRLFPSLGEQ
jgi:hypothetical protein